MFLLCTLMFFSSFLNLWESAVTILKSLAANSFRHRWHFLLCFGWSVFLPIMGYTFLFLSCLVIFDRMLDIFNFVFLCTGHYCIPVSILRFALGCSKVTWKQFAHVQSSFAFKLTCFPSLLDIQCLQSHCFIYFTRFRCKVTCSPCYYLFVGNGNLLIF